jgi:hypothetical protein
MCCHTVVSPRHVTYNATRKITSRVYDLRIVSIARTKRVSRRRSLAMFRYAAASTRYLVLRSKTSRTASKVRGLSFVSIAKTGRVFGRRSL